jgi:hypothetical protein
MSAGGNNAEQDMDRVRAARQRFDVLLKKEIEPDQQASVYGILASAEKRIAELRWRQLKVAKQHTVEDKIIEVRDRLISSRNFYEKTFQRDRSQVWALVQVLALNAVLRRWHQAESRPPEARWELARRFSDEEVYLGNADRLSWANANLMELYVLAPLIPTLNIGIEEARREAERYARNFVSVTEAKSINLHSTRRQMERYRPFFADVNDAMKVAADIADAVLAILPRSLRY